MSSTIPLKDMKKETLNIAAEMFLYLNSCPYTIKPWVVFFKSLFQTKSPNYIILTLNRMLKGNISPTNKQFKSTTENLLIRATQLFSLKYPYIKSMAPGSKENSWKLQNESIMTTEGTV